MSALLPRPSQPAQRPGRRSARRLVQAALLSRLALGAAAASLPSSFLSGCGGGDEPSKTDAAARDAQPAPTPDLDPRIALVENGRAIALVGRQGAKVDSAGGSVRDTGTAAGGVADAVVLRLEDLPPEYAGLSIVATAFDRAVLSPDGKTLAFTTSADQEVVAVYDLATRDLRIAYLFYEGGAGGLVWSPDSKYLAYDGTPAGGISSVGIVARDGGTAFGAPLLRWYHRVGQAVAEPRWEKTGTALNVWLPDSSGLKVALAPGAKAEKVGARLMLDPEARAFVRPEPLFPLAALAGSRADTTGWSVFDLNAPAAADSAASGDLTASRDRTASVDRNASGESGGAGSNDSSSAGKEDADGKDGGRGREGGGPERAREGEDGAAGFQRVALLARRVEPAQDAASASPLGASPASRPDSEVSEVSVVSVPAVLVATPPAGPKEAWKSDGLIRLDVGPPTVDGFSLKSLRGSPSLERLVDLEGDSTAALVVSFPVEDAGGPLLGLIRIHEDHAEWVPVDMRGDVTASVQRAPTSTLRSAGFLMGSAVADTVVLALEDWTADNRLDLVVYKGTRTPEAETSGVGNDGFRWEARGFRYASGHFVPDEALGHAAAGLRNEPPEVGPFPEGFARPDPSLMTKTKKKSPPTIRSGKNPKPPTSSRGGGGGGRERKSSGNSRGSQGDRGRR